ncbi:MAG: hypothetical protein ABJK37_09220 [Paraglaciecola sp.]|uniref:hypothetical protein n=1 Tax=Paraglaciecola sp. TaxID=1920173 RepID=UPI00329A3DAD
MTRMSLIAITSFIGLSAFMSPTLADDLKSTESVAVITNALDSAFVAVDDKEYVNGIPAGVVFPTPTSPTRNPELVDGGIDTSAAPGGGGGDPGGPGLLGPSSEDIFARLNTDFTVSPHTTDLLGDSVDVNNGNVMFRNTDIVIPGNGLGLDIVISRTMKGSANSFSQHNTYEPQVGQ